MTTRRFRGGGQGGGKPQTRLGARARVPEREVTTTDVTQHATEILTDQDFLITTPSTGDVFIYDGANWVNTGQAALTITESQITDGSILARLAANETVTGAWTFGADVTFSANNQITINSNADENELLRFGIDRPWAFEQKSTGATTGLRLRSINTNKRFEIIDSSRTYSASFIPDGLPFHLYSSQNEVARFETASATGSPYLTFYQAGTKRAQILYLDSNDVLSLQNLVGGLEFRPAGNANLATTIGSSGAMILRSSQNEILRLQRTSATGSPYVSFYQSGTRRAYIQFRDSDDSLRIFNDVNDDSWDFKSNGDFVANDGDVIATV